MRDGQAFSRLVLGTAQWGMDYGVANETGRPSRAEISRIVEVAESKGVRTLDTARAYGSSEETIGAVLGARDQFQVVTKLSHDLDAGEPTVAEAAARVQASIDASRVALRRDCLDVVLLHRESHRRLHSGAIWEFLLRARDAGRVSRVGISAESPQAAITALEAPGAEVIQVAASLLDRRLEAAGFFKRAEELGIEIHVRSVFVQGLAHLPVEKLPGKLSGIAPVLSRLDSWCYPQRRGELFLQYAYLAYGPRLVLGCETSEQLLQNLTSLERAQTLTVTKLEELRAIAQTEDARLVDPASWHELP